MTTELIINREMLRTLLAQQYPFVFVDESQDTTKIVVDALLATANGNQPQFCLGFFGDPMQQIYQSGIGNIPTKPSWAKITKRQNFRCPPPVLQLANAIRRSGDGIEQIPGRAVTTSGSARIFILDNRGEREERVAKVRALVAVATADSKWVPNYVTDDVKVLVIVHRMAAKRLGFGKLYAALNDKAPGAFKDRFLDGTAWPLRPLIQFIMPLIEAKTAGDAFAVMQVLRKHSPLLEPTRLEGVNFSARLTELGQFTQKIRLMTASESTATIADVLREIKAAGVINLDPRLLTYLATNPESSRSQTSTVATEDGEELTKELRSMDAFLACPASELSGYVRYINDRSPFSTQQGIKGTEFERVLVIADDEESSYSLFSYDRYFGVSPLSETDQENQAEGRETAVHRTRRLFYVCCTRALKDLVVVYFTANVQLAKTNIINQGLFPESSIFTPTL